MLPGSMPMLLAPAVSVAVRGSRRPFARDSPPLRFDALNGKLGPDAAASKKGHQASIEVAFWDQNLQGEIVGEWLEGARFDTDHGR
jgi:hypothetical protein